MLAPDQVLPFKSSPLRVLLADDNLSNSLLLKRILEGAGHSVILAKGGNEAFDLMVSGKPDLAILDLNMPEMAGPDIVKLYRAGETGSLAHMPIIILSADATPDAKEDSLSAGADEFLSKPVSASDLLAALARYSRLDEPEKVEVSENAPDGRMEVAANDSAVASATPAAALRAINAQRTLVDGERVNALREIANDDRGFIQQYASAAFEDLDLAIGELRSALLHEDERAARDALHKIDGTAASIGAGALIQASKRFRGDYLGTWRRSANCEAALLELNKLCALSRQAFTIEITQTPSKPASR